MIQERNHEYEDLFRDHRTHAIAPRARPLQTNLREHDDGSLARSHEGSSAGFCHRRAAVLEERAVEFAHETLVLGPGFTFAIDIDGFGRAITFEQHGSSWRVAADKEPDFVIEFRDLDYAFDVFSGAISLKEALAARLFATHGANSKGVAITYLFDTVLHTFFCWRSAYRR